MVHLVERIARAIDRPCEAGAWLAAASCLALAFLLIAEIAATSLAGGPLIAIFLVADGGGIAGGWLSTALIKHGWTINAARKTTLLACALCVVPVFLTPLVGNLWVSVALVALAASAHCGFAANLFTLVSDTVPREAVSSVVGIGGMAGSVAGMFFAQLVARVLHFTHNNYLVPFSLAATLYLLALGLIHLLIPRLEPMSLPASCEAATPKAHGVSEQMRR